MRNTKRFILILVMIFVCLLIYSVFTGLYQYVYNQLTELATSEQRISGRLANQTTYTSKDFGFSIDYPNGYTIKEYEVTNENNKIVSFEKDATLHWPHIYVSYVTSMANKQDFVLKDWVRERYYDENATTLPVSGKIPNSIHIESLQTVHYASIDTYTIKNGKVLDISMGARDPNTPFTDTEKEMYYSVVQSFE